MSVISQVTATPSRVEAIFNAVSDAGKIGVTVEDLDTLVSPKSHGTRDDVASKSTSIARGVISETQKLGLIDKTDSGKLRAVTIPKTESLFSVLETRLISNPDGVQQDQIDFPMALSWILSQPASLPIKRSIDLRTRITDQCGGDNGDFGIGLVASSQQFYYWARYFGFVSFIPNHVMIDPTEAMKRHIVGVLVNDDEIGISQFFSNLSQKSPVFEQGRYREKIHELGAAKIQESPQDISTSSSMALHSLEKTGYIHLHSRSDAPALNLLDWTSKNVPRPITHISKRKLTIGSKLGVSV